jgi:hypothetical protein
MYKGTKIMYKGTKISKNFEIDKIIDDPIQIMQLANAGKSIYVVNWDRMQPAMFIFNMQFSLVIKWMNNNKFYTVKKINNE